MDFALKGSMESIEKKIKITKLFNLYGYFLSNAQKEIMYDYFFMDLSLSEISENRKISRSAVEDAIKKGSAKLEKYDADLGLLEKHAQISDKLDDLSSKVDDPKSIEEIKKKLEELYYGI